MIWVLITDINRSSSELPSVFADAVIGANICFPLLWSAWSVAVDKNYVEYNDAISSVVVGLSLGLSAATVSYNTASLIFGGVDSNLQILALVVFSLPAVAWLLAGHPAGVMKLAKTVIKSGFTVILFSPHHFSASSLHVAVRINDLLWRGNHGMVSEDTDPHQLKNIAWYAVAIHLVGSMLFMIKQNSVNSLALSLFLGLPQVLPLVMGIWMWFTGFRHRPNFRVPQARAERQTPVDATEAHPEDANIISAKEGFYDAEDSML